MITRVAVYARKSTRDERSAKEGKSVDRQVEQARAFCTAQGWAVTKTITDDGVSGGEFVNRPGFREVMDLSRRKPRPFDVLLVWKLDRLGRDQERLALALKDLHDSDVEIWEYEYQERVKLDTPHDRLVASIKAFAAEAERHAGGERVRSAAKARALKGGRTGAKTFGYDSVADGQRKVRKVNEEQAAIVRRIFDRYADGDGAMKIARTLNAENVPAPGKGGWTKRGVNWLLRNEIYSGRVVYGKTTTRSRHGKVRVAQKVNPSDWVVAENEDLRIVAEPVWQAVQARTEGARTAYLRGDKGQLLGQIEGAGVVADHLLNGIARCSECDGALSFMSKGSGRNYYYCGKMLHGSKCTNRRGVPADQLEQSVRDAVAKRLQQDPAKVADLVAENVKRIKREHEIAVAAWLADNPDPAAEVVKLEAEISNLVAAVASGKAPAAILDAIKAKEAQVEELRTLSAPQLPEWLTGAVAAANADHIEGPAGEPRHEFLARMASLENLGLELLTSATRPRLARQVLRRLGVDRIIVTPTADGWVLSGEIDLAPILAGRDISGGSGPVTLGTRDGPPHPPHARHAPGNPGRSSITRAGWGPDMAPTPPTRSSRPGKPGALLDNPRGLGPRHGPPHPPHARHAPGNPGRSSITRAGWGPDMAPHTPHTLVTPRETRGAPR
jgi:site-specific DNA recombinase